MVCFACAERTGSTRSDRAWIGGQPATTSLTTRQRCEKRRRPCSRVFERDWTTSPTRRWIEPRRMSHPDQSRRCRLRERSDLTRTVGRPCHRTVAGSGKQPVPTVIDTYSRECLSLHVDGSLPAPKLTAERDLLCAELRLARGNRPRSRARECTSSKRASSITVPGVERGSEVVGCWLEGRLVAAACALLQDRTAVRLGRAPSSLPACLPPSEQQ